MMNDQIDKLNRQLKEAEEIISFYANRFSWKFCKHPNLEYFAGEIKDDSSLVEYREADGDIFTDYSGGKRAREYFIKKDKK